MSAGPADRAAFGELADRIESEMRSAGVGPTPAPAVPITGGPFGAPEATFFQWLEHVLCPRLREIAAGRSEPPPHSEVATAAARNFDGYDGTDGLLAALAKVDRLAGSR
ncbi:MAG: YqcC family protein [Solirubrobacteraceae bacterium]